MDEWSWPDNTRRPFVFIVPALESVMVGYARMVHPDIIGPDFIAIAFSHLEDLQDQK